MTTLVVIGSAVHHRVVLDLISVERYRARIASAKPTASAWLQHRVPILTVVGGGGS